MGFDSIIVRRLQKPALIPQNCGKMSHSRVTFQPSLTYEEALERTGQVWGVESEYWDIWGEHHQVPAAVRRALMEAMGVPANTRESLDAAARERLLSEWSSLLPPVLVIGEQEPSIDVAIEQERAADRCLIEIRWERGGSVHWEIDLNALPVKAEAEFEGRVFIRKVIPLRRRMELGYHEIAIHLSSGAACQSRLIVCPDQAYRPPFLSASRRAAGLGVALYGLRSERNWGCGDFTDLKNLIDWVATEIGGDFIALNPLHALANRHPYNSSPYLPISSLYRNHIYLDIERIPDFAPAGGPRYLESPSVREELAYLRSAEYIDYERTSCLKWRFLRLCFRSFLHREYYRQTERAHQFAAYVEREGETLDRYAIFRALDEAIHRRHPNVWVWRDWPEEYRDPKSEAVAEFARRHWRSVLFHKYVQWQLELQLSETQRHALARGMKIGLYHDLALATDRWGGDVWAYREFYVTGCRVGAPPDAFSPNGQDWGFPPPNSTCHWNDGYRLFRESIRKNAAHGGALRIDHVMRFFRLYWIPEGEEAKNGGYVMDRYRDLIRILALESVRGQFLVIGEDLGTVADFIRESMERFGILSYRLFYFERRKDGSLKLPAEYPRRALVSATTHDLPTLAGFWTFQDIHLRYHLGLIPSDAAYRQQLEERVADRQRMLDALHLLGLLPEWFPRCAADVPELTGELHNAITGFLAMTPSELFVLNQEDLLKQPVQQNLPGTTHEYPNWRHRMRFSIEQLWRVPFVRDCASMFRNWLLRTGRANGVLTGEEAAWPAGSFRREG